MLKKKYAIKTSICAIFFVLLWGMIFGFSAQTGTQSGGLSDKLAEVAADILDALFQWKITPKKLSFPIRKMAHMTEYALLWLDSYGMIYYGRRYKEEVTKEDVDKREKKFPERISLIISLVVVFLTAVSDEIHQLFVPDRVGTIVDVGWDMLGVLLCVSFIFFLTYFRLDRRQKKKVRKQ